MKKKICVVTATRAEYHLLYPLLKAIQNEGCFTLDLVVTGSHLSEQYGNTVEQIEQDGFTHFQTIPILDTDKQGISQINQTMANTIIGFDAYFSKNKPDVLVILGDRYEMLSVAITAMNYQIPIAHLHGGETTEGAIDECIRHAITKMSYLHFTSCEVYRNRVIQLGESPERVYNVGAIGIENIRNQKRLTLEQLEQSLQFSLGTEFAVVTFHPVTLEQDTAEQQFSELLCALDAFPNMKILFTKSNADNGGLEINQMIDEYTQKNLDRCTAVFSLGMTRYLTALQYAKVVIGNSSSGIVETPSIPVATVNIGDRQKGRVQAQNILNCPPEKKAIIHAVETACSPSFQQVVSETISPYGDGDVTSKIIKHLKYHLFEKNIDLKKKFYNI